MPPSGGADGGIEERGIKPEGDAARESNSWSHTTHRHTRCVHGASTMHQQIDHDLITHFAQIVQTRQKSP